MFQHYFSVALHLKERWFKKARKGRLKQMKFIYKIMKENGVEEDIKKWRNSGDRTILMEASLSGNINILKWLIQELHFDVNKQNNYGWSALHFAAIYNRIECAQFLVDIGSLHLRSYLRPSGKTPLDYAKEYGNIEMQKLLECGHKEMINSETKINFETKQRKRFWRNSDATCGRYSAENLGKRRGKFSE